MKRTWLSRKARGAWYIMRDLFIAAFDGQLAPYVDRAHTSAARRVAWQVQLSAAILALSALLFLGILVVAGALLFAIPTIFGFSALAEIWGTRVHISRKGQS